MIVKVTNDFTIIINSHVTRWYFEQRIQKGNMIVHTNATTAAALISISRVFHYDRRNQ